MVQRVNPLLLRTACHNDVMSNHTNVTSTSRLHTVAVIFASVIIAAPILTGKIVEAIMDSSNPAGLDDLNAPLAYLSEILVSSFTVLAIVLIIFLISTIMLGLRDRSWAAISLPVTIAIIQIVVGIAALLLGQAVSSIDGA